MPPVVIAVAAGAVAVDVVTGGGVQKAAGEVIKAGGKVVDAVVDVGRAIAKDPLPVIATVALTAAGIPAPISTAAVTAAQGGSVKDIATSAVAAAVGGKVGGEVGGAVGKSATGAAVAATTKTSIETVARVAASAAGASSATVTAGVLQGQPLDKVLEKSLVAGVGGGVGEAASIGAQKALPVDSRAGQGFIAGVAGGGAQAAVTGQDITKGAILSGITTAGGVVLGDYRAKQEAERAATTMKDLVATAAKDPSVNIKVAGAMPVTAEQVQQLTRMAESKVAEDIIRKAANDPKFIRQAANESSLQVLREAGYTTLANALSRVAVGMTTLVTPGNIGQETNEDAIMAERWKKELAPIASKDFALAPVTVTAPAITKLQPNESISRDGALLENGKPTGLFVDKAGTLYDEAGNPMVKNYAPANAVPPTVTKTISPSLPLVTPTRPTTPAPKPAPAPTISPSITPTPTSAPTPAPLPKVSPAVTPAPLAEPAPAPSPAAKPAPAPEPARTVTTPTAPLRPVIAPIDRDTTPPATPPTISEKDKAILDLIDTAKPKEEQPEIGEETVVAKPEEEVVDDEKLASQKFPLTEPDATGTKRPLIKYDYANVDPVLANYMRGGGAGMPSSTALAQALGVGDPGALYLGKKGKERRPVWNVESLKLRDELGGDYG